MVQLEEHVSAWEGKWFELLRTTQTNVLLLNVPAKLNIIPTNTEMHFFFTSALRGEGGGGFGDSEECVLPWSVILQDTR